MEEGVAGGKEGGREGGREGRRVGVLNGRKRQKEGPR